MCGERVRGVLVSTLSVEKRCVCCIPPDARPRVEEAAAVGDQSGWLYRVLVMLGQKTNVVLLDCLVLVVIIGVGGDVVEAQEKEWYAVPEPAPSSVALALALARAVVPGVCRAVARSPSVASRIGRGPFLTRNP